MQFLVFLDVLILKLEIVEPVANSHHHVSRHYLGLPSTALFATVVHCQLSLPTLPDVVWSTRDLIVFVTKLRLIFVQGSWKQDLLLMMVSLYSCEIFRLLLLLRFIKEVGCVRQRGRVRVTH